MSKVLKVFARKELWLAVFLLIGVVGKASGIELLPEDMRDEMAQGVVELVSDFVVITTAVSAYFVESQFSKKKK